jgi:hypothetical protein
MHQPGAVQVRRAWAAPNLGARRTGTETGGVRVQGLGLSTPSASLEQDEVLELLGLAGDPFAERIFARSGVERRRLEVSPRTVGTTLQARTGAPR